MNVQIITSSYPAFTGDPGGTAGLFVEAFAQELTRRGHRVVVQPVKRKTDYAPADGVIVEPIPWEGGDQVLAAMNLYDPRNWRIFWNFFRGGRANTAAIHRKYEIDRTLCMWVIPSGLFGYWLHKDLRKPYDVWALGSDIWKIRNIPVIGSRLINRVVANAAQVYADGQQLAADVTDISGRKCHFLASSRILPVVDDTPPSEDGGRTRLLFVGRYHKNKGPDMLLEALLFLDEKTRKSIQVDLYGLGDLEGQLQACCREHHMESYVTIHGPINAEDLARQLKRAEFLLIPSRIESVPVIFSDAMQCGTPVVSTPVGDLPYFIDKYRCGVVSDGVTPLSYAAAIKGALKGSKRDYTYHVETAYQELSVAHSVEVWLENIRSS
ncbi:MAG: glycosyltransferase family 4 protein [Candidatus Omnitrophica bacterium]|nr:glycosyltransferase family 4 protein [Candidatus Omnitrophota bacterium]